MASNRIRDVIVNHFTMKKQTICHISGYLGHRGYETVHTVSGILEIQSQDFHGCHAYQTGTKQV